MLRKQEITVLVEAHGWPHLKWAQLTKVGSDSGKVWRSFPHRDVQFVASSHVYHVLHWTLHAW